MNTIETPKPKQNTTSKEEALETRKAYRTDEEFRRHRDELSRLLLADFIDSALPILSAAM